MARVRSPLRRAEVAEGRLKRETDANLAIDTGLREWSFRSLRPVQKCPVSFNDKNPSAVTIK
jgi:hypothetical protein